MKELIEAALRRELDGYVRRGRVDRARQVVDQLVLLGCDVSEVLSRLSSTVPAEEGFTSKPAKKAAVRKVKK
jgi:pentatricopeptide repeat protein